MGKLIDYFKDMSKVLELAEKPEADEFKQILKMVFLGFVAIGALSFSIAFTISFLLNTFGAGISP